MHFHPGLKPIIEQNTIVVVKDQKCICEIKINGHNEIISDNFLYAPDFNRTVPAKKIKIFLFQVSF